MSCDTMSIKLAESDGLTDTRSLLTGVSFLDNLRHSLTSALSRAPHKHPQSALCCGWLLTARTQHSLAHSC